jgi:Txe/YoeB family toxin of toxin-antitoxin system
LAYKVGFSKRACKDLEKIKRSKLAGKVYEISCILSENPYKSPPSFEKLNGNLEGRFSRRVNEQHRYVYRVLPNDTGEKDGNGNLYEGFVKVQSVWSHYE